MSLRILIVDDDKHTCRILQTLIGRDPPLRERGVEVTLASDGEEGLRALDAGPVHLVISDLLMPGMDGFTFCRELRRRPDGVSVPLIVSSAVYKDPITIRKLNVEVGAEFFTKPFQVAEMIAAVRRRLGIVPAATAPAAAEAPAGPAVGLRGLVADHPLPRLLLDLFEARSSVCLLLQRGEQHLRLHLLMGHVVAAESSNRADALGSFLHMRGLLTEAQLCEALQGARDHGQRVGQVLIERGWIDEARLLQEMEAQLRTRLCAVLGWEGASFCLEPPRPAYERVLHPAGTPVLLFSALREVIRPEEIEADLRARGGRLVEDPRLDRVREPFEQVFGAGSLRVLSRRPLVAELYAGLREAERDALTVRIDALLRCGLISAQAAALGGRETGGREGGRETGRTRSAEARPMAPGAIEVQVLTPAATEAGPLDPRHRQLLSDYLAADGRDHYRLLGVAPDADVPAIQEAYEIALRRLSPERFRDLDLGPDYGKISELRERHRQAHLVLTSAVRRAAYDRERARDRAQAQIGPVHAELLFREGAALLSSGQLEAALRPLELAAAEAPDQAEYFALLGWARFLLRRQRGEDAQAAALWAWPALQRALLIDEGNLTARAYLGHIDVALEEDERAAGHFERVLDAQPDRRDVIAGLERALRRTGQLPRLALRYRRLLRRLQASPAAGDGADRAALARDLEERLRRLEAALATAAAADAATATAADPNGVSRPA